MFDLNDSVPPAHLIGKLAKVEEGILETLLARADILLERKKAAAYFGMQVEEGNPVVPNPVVFFGNMFRRAANLAIHAHTPAHIMYPAHDTSPNMWGSPGVLTGIPIYTKIRISPVMAEAMLHHIESSPATLTRAAGITPQEIRDLKSMVCGKPSSNDMAIRP